ncbi:putative transmembrane protein [Oceanicola granulosus HTCC2516]|uniref:Putative transmembrane protein n=1 Tax=Oceanicola granulosus (strain ATCC BAA-861 / DSM 15982 / KCTC 12143 / HTCC2516) TaxID=314256 RepID=Q2CCE4_OCEGH|nr:AzlD domain-containing protein [Oceanicola granulosus]EAR50374.1 putative transmembrane protein [Oceanicola granulosus HTCC2516]
MIEGIWLLILLLGIGTFLIRFSFLGLIGDRTLPPLVLRLLRYTPVAVIPGMIAPLILWPAATGGAPDPARLSAALATLVAGLLTKNLLIAILAGVAVFYGMGLLG